MYNRYKNNKYPDSIDNGVKAVADFGDDTLIPYFIYCFRCELSLENSKYIHEFNASISSKMKKYGVQTSVLTKSVAI